MQNFPYYVIFPVPRRKNWCRQALILNGKKNAHNERILHGCSLTSSYILKRKIEMYFMSDYLMPAIKKDKKRKRIYEV